MDLATLIRNVIDQLKGAKTDFQSGQTYDDKKGAYDNFIGGVEKLHKIYKAQNTTQTASQKIKEILTSALKDAEVMKGELNNLPKNSNNKSKVNTPSGNGKDNKNSNTHAPPDKDKTKMQDALSGAIVTEKPNVKWEDVAGLDNAKKALQEAIILPTKFPDIFVGLRKPWKGILLYGPPGTGKTFLAKACATQADSTFFSVSSSDLISKYVGESEKLIKTLFEMARQQSPSIIFIDEIDSLVSARSEGENEASRRVKTEFLVQMQGVGNANDTGILVLGATNLPWALDSAIRRRFEKRIYIPLPDYEARLYLFKSKMKDEDHNLTEADFRELGQASENYSGSDLNNLIKNACYEPLRKFQNAIYFKKVGTNSKGRPLWTPCAPSDSGATKIDKTQLQSDDIQKNVITKFDFFKALSSTKPTVGVEDLKKYDSWTNDFGMKG